MAGATTCSSSAGQCLPSQIESILLDVKEIEPSMSSSSKEGYLDQLHVDVEARQETYDAALRRLRGREDGREQDPRDDRHRDEDPTGAT